MPGMSRRKVLGTSLGVAAAGVLARPYVARAAAKTAEVWWTQGFIPEEDESFRKMVADYERASGNTIDYSILPFVALEQKMVSALQTNNTPDVISFDGIETTLVLNAWNDKLVDVSDVVATQEKKFSDTALLSTKLYNKVNKGRAFYCRPIQVCLRPVPRLVGPGGEGRLQDGGPPEYLGRTLGLVQADAGEAARQGHAPDLSVRSPDDDQWPE